MPIINFFTRVRKKANALAKTVNRLIGNLQKRTGNDAEQSIEEFNRLSGTGHSDGWRFDRNEIHERQ